MSPEYKAAYEAHNAALAAYEAVVSAYRAKKIDDAEFFAAREIKVAADAAFDAAWLAESEREDDAEAAVEADDSQLALI